MLKQSEESKMEHNLYISKFAWKMLWYLPETRSFGSGSTSDGGDK